MARRVLQNCRSIRLRNPRNLVLSVGLRQAVVGYLRDHRPDCVQVIIALVVTAAGLPLTYEMLPGGDQAIRPIFHQPRRASRP